MKTEFEKMRSQELYDFSDEEIEKSLIHAKKTCAHLQTMTIFDDDYQEVSTITMIFWVQRYEEKT